MADTIRKQILDSLVAHLKTETWVTSAGVGINPGKTKYKKVEMPGMSVFAGQEQASTEGYGAQDCNVEVELRYVGLLVNSLDSPFDIAEDIRGQIIKSAMTATLGGLANSMEYAGGTVDYPTVDDETIQVSVLINIKYETLIQNPYSQGD